MWSVYVVLWNRGKSSKLWGTIMWSLYVVLWNRRKSSKLWGRPRNGQSRLQGTDPAAGFGPLTPSPAPLSFLHLPVGLSQWEAPSDNRRRDKEQRGPTHAQPARVLKTVVESHCAGSSSLSSSWSPHSPHLFTPAVAMPPVLVSYGCCRQITTNWI